jgi:hypothetical protein
MQREDAVAVPWMAKFDRNPWPKKIVWLQDDVTHTRFYWLGLSKDEAKGGQLIEAEVDGQTITIKASEKSPGEIVLRLSHALIDLDAPIKVLSSGKPLFEGKVSPTIEAIAKSLAERADPKSAASAELTIVLSTKEE